MHTPKQIIFVTTVACVLLGVSMTRKPIATLRGENNMSDSEAGWDKPYKVWKDKVETGVVPMEEPYLHKESADTLSIGNGTGKILSQIPGCGGFSFPDRKTGPKKTVVFDQEKCTA